MLKVDNLFSAYSRIEVLHGVSFEVHQGSLVTIVGSNGAGKTTLMRAISGVQPISGGSIDFCGKKMDAVPAHRRVRSGIAQVPEGRHVFPPLSVEDNLQLGGWSRTRSERESDILEIYGMFPVLAEKRGIAAGSLSGGQQQMLAIGRALMSRPKLLLLDEPSMGLAPILVDQIFAVLPELKSRGITVLLVEQNAYAALAIADYGYVMETGRIVASGSGDALLHDPKIRSSYLGLEADEPSTANCSIE